MKISVIQSIVLCLCLSGLALGQGASIFGTDGNLVRKSGTNGIADISLSTNGTLSGNSDTAVPSEAAVRKYVALRQLSVLDYGAKGDGRYSITGSVTSGSPTLTDTNGAFTSADTGKRIVLYGGLSGNAQFGTVTFVNATTVTLSFNSATNATATARYYIGSDDTTAIGSAISAALAANRKVCFPAGIYITDTQTINGAVLLEGESVMEPMNNNGMNATAHVGSALVSKLGGDVIRFTNTYSSHSGARWLRFVGAGWNDSNGGSGVKYVSSGIEDTRHVRMDYVVFEEFAGAGFLWPAAESTIYHLSITNFQVNRCNKGISILATHAPCVQLVHGYVFGYRTAGIEVAGANDLLLQNVEVTDSIDDNGKTLFNDPPYTYSITPMGMKFSDPVDSATLINCHFEDCTGEGLHLSQGYAMLNLIGCDFQVNNSYNPTPNYGIWMEANCAVNIQAMGLSSGNSSLLANGTLFHLAGTTGAGPVITFLGAALPGMDFYYCHSDNSVRRQGVGGIQFLQFSSCRNPFFLTDQNPPTGQDFAARFWRTGAVNYLDLGDTIIRDGTAVGMPAGTWYFDCMLTAHKGLTLGPLSGSPAEGTIGYDSTAHLPQAWTTNGSATIPLVAASGNLTGQSGAIASIASFTPSADGTFDIGAYVTVTAAGSGAALSVQVTYTDDTSTARTMTLATAGASPSTTIGAAGAYNFAYVPIRAKAGNAITVKTTFSGSSITYNAGANIKQSG